jgi:DNA ligase-1
MGIELGIGEMLLVKAIAESTGRATTKIKEDLRREGDLGKVAMVSRLTQRITLLMAAVSEQSANDVQAEAAYRPGRVQGPHGYRQGQRECCTWL